MMRFEDREDAGRRLAEELRSYTAEQPIVLALPRGGVPVGVEVARALNAPLDVWVVRKLGVPWHRELGVGAVAEGDYVYVDRQMLRRVGLSDEALAELIEQKRGEVDERVRKFRGERPPPQLEGRTVIVVDDGIATSGTARAAIRSIRHQNPASLVLAVPVAAPEIVRALEPEVDDLIVLLSPPQLYAIGLWFVDFAQVPDEEVVSLLEQARRGEQAGGEQAGERGGPHAPR